MTTLYKNFMYIALCTVLLLLVPFYFTMTGAGGGGWLWVGGDYIFAFVVIAGVLSMFEYVRQRAGSGTYKVASGVALAVLFALVWINAAVGIIGEDDWPNLLYLGLVVFGLAGAAWSRLEACRMSHTLFVMALAQMAIPAIVLAVSPDMIAQQPGTAAAFGLNAVFAAGWVVSGLLFRHASQLTQNA